MDYQKSIIGWLHIDLKSDSLDYRVRIAVLHENRHPRLLMSRTNSMSILILNYILEANILAPDDIIPLGIWACKTLILSETHLLGLYYLLMV